MTLWPHSREASLANKLTETLFYGLSGAFRLLFIFFTLIFLIVQIIPYICKAYSCRKPGKGKSKGGHIYLKRRNCTLWFWRLRTWKIQNDQSRTKQRGRPVGCIYIASWTFRVTVCYGKLFGYVGYIYHRGAFGVARFDWSGSSRALRREASDRELAPRFFCICTYHLNLLICSLRQPVAQNHVFMDMKEFLSYVAPVVRVIEVEVEKGFATSGGDFEESGRN